MVKRQTMVCLRTLYTVAILGLGYKFILKYLHNIPISAYVVRNVFQLGFAFLIPEIGKIKS
jgi:hypothetical protein